MRFPGGPCGSHVFLSWDHLGPAAEEVMDNGDEREQKRQEHRT